MNDRVKSLPPDEQRQVIAEAVMELAVEQNFSDITTTAISNRTGITCGTLFRLFPGTDAVGQVFIEWVAKRLMSRVDNAARGADSPGAALEAIFMTNIDFLIEHPSVPRVMLGELKHPGRTAPKRLIQIFMRHYRKRLSGLIDEGKTLGELSIEITTDEAVTHFICTIQGLLLLALVSGDSIDIRSEASRAFVIYRRGIRNVR